jgi:hypothetical protein
MRPLIFLKLELMFRLFLIVIYFLNVEHNEILKFNQMKINMSSISLLKKKEN